MQREVNLEALRGKDPSSVEIAIHFLRQDGFVFLEMTSDTDRLLQKCTPPFRAAAEFLHEKSSRGNGSRNSRVLHGHVSHRYKDSLRLLSGNQFDSFYCPLQPSLRSLALAMDEAAKDVTEALAMPLFGLKSSEQVGDLYDLPLLAPRRNSNQRCYGMVDIVCYHNDPVTPRVVVSPHQDPGLFVLALPEMAPGLELLEQSQNGQETTWVSPPPGKGVLWAGQRAGFGAIHRVVVKQPGTARVACWHEICTAGQVSEPMLQHLKETNQELAMGDVVGTNAVLSRLWQSENHEYPSFVKTGNKSSKRSWFSSLLPSPDPPRSIPTKLIQPPAGISVPDTVGLWESEAGGVPVRKSSGKVMPLPIPVLEKRPVCGKTSQQQTPKEDVKQHNNYGLGYTVTYEAIPRVGIPMPKASEELNIRVTVRKNRPPWWQQAALFGVLGAIFAWLQGNHSS